MCRVGRERLFTCRTQIDFVKVMWWEEKLAIALDVVVVGSVVARKIVTLSLLAAELAML